MGIKKHIPIQPSSPLASFVFNPRKPSSPLSAFRENTFAALDYPRLL
jgi:hypothetical protein